MLWKRKSTPGSAKRTIDSTAFEEVLILILEFFCAVSAYTMRIFSVQNCPKHALIKVV